MGLFAPEQQDLPWAWTERAEMGVGDGEPNVTCERECLTLQVLCHTLDNIEDAGDGDDIVLSRAKSSRNSLSNKNADCTDFGDGTRT
jgi:hypothetical protein